MHYLPLFEPGGVELAGSARQRDEPSMLSKKALFLGAPGDAIRLRARGRQLGIVFARHPWSGIAEVTVGAERRQLDLFAERARHWVFETTLPSATDPAPVSVRLLPAKNPAAKGTDAWIQGIYTSEYLTSEVPDLIRRHVDSPPFDGAALNQLTDVFKWYEPDWLAALNALASSPPYRPPDFVHRKSWEWTQCIFGLDCLGMLRPEHRALGIGVGWEPLSFFFSNHLREVVATDLYPVDEQWSRTGAREGNPEILADPDKFAPFPYRKDRLRFMRMNGTRLTFPDRSFDVVWSCSSIEHFGGHQGAARAMQEIERVLTPGGVACVITEYVLPDPITRMPTSFDAEYFNLRCLYEYLIRSVPGLRLVQNVDLSIPDYYVRRACNLPEEAGAPHTGSTKPHIVLRTPSGVLLTSVALFFRKAGGSTDQQPRRLFTDRAPGDSRV